MLCGDLNGKEIQKTGGRGQVYVWLIHFVLQQKLMQPCKAIILQ